MGLVGPEVQMFLLLLKHLAKVFQERLLLIYRAPALTSEVVGSPTLSTALPVMIKSSNRWTAGTQYCWGLPFWSESQDHWQQWTPSLIFHILAGFPFWTEHVGALTAPPIHWMFPYLWPPFYLSPETEKNGLPHVRQLGASGCRRSGFGGLTRSTRVLLAFTVPSSACWPILLNWLASRSRDGATHLAAICRQ